MAEAVFVPSGRTEGAYMAVHPRFIWIADIKLTSVFILCWVKIREELRYEEKD
ncbi:MAG: hypothetical protein FWD03_04545 [Defluviitaleaceae bacterium]|nr:hypothetical protein [Defluviitaleaceae bacterium]